MIETYLNTLATVLGSMEEAKKNMYVFTATTYTGFQCTLSEETSEKFKGLPGVLWVLPDSYIDVKNKDMEVISTSMEIDVSIQLINQSKLEVPNTRAKHMSDREMAPLLTKEKQDKERLLNPPLDL